MLTINEHLKIPMDEFQREFSRAGGPGGQNVNKVNSKALIRWTPGTSPSLPEPVRERLLKLLANRLTSEGELLIVSQKTRDQARNLDDCFDKLRAIILSALRPPKTRRPTRPTYGSQLRRVDSKVRRSETKRTRKAPDHE